MNTPGGESIPAQNAGVSLDTISKLARLGLIFESSHLSHGDGRAYPVASFSFIPDSPLGRANAACGTDVDILDGIIGDAKSLSYDGFVARFPNFGPYDS